eukprot:CAMPEP_0206464902 /NCGR_PEP_ID=MMETSP0324_2-20121206/27494_1 /ASSEMBLY_ACC=CAM_ASM_000836 /TAXON_ID=2866 /ORGANISM="Crypthecodinium cohnii, Strain Seligo" /LENGTH=215 /DNA_ID=CAMNT_0053937625 /DNA_START=116 /DNA_END=763 /DNA_ORIENTATION=+
MAAYGNPSIHGNSRVHQSEDHPYDRPYGKMIDMSNAIQELRAMLLAEQQQRAAEVTELRNEVHMLREALKQETQNRDTVVHKLMKELQPVNQTKDFDELRTQLRKQVTVLEAGLADEVRDRRAAEVMRDTKDASREADLRSGLNALCQDLAHHKTIYGTTKDEHKNQINRCIHDLHLLAGGVQRVTQAWTTVPLGNLQTSDVNGSSAGVCPGGSK